jgi:pectinesterase
MRKLLLLLAFMTTAQVGLAASKYDNPDTIVVARDGTGQFRTVDEAIEVCRAFMDYHKVIFVKNGTYKEKLIIPSWL